MKKCMLRGKDKKTRMKYKVKSLPNSFEYGVWYLLITPFDSQYFKFKKCSRYVGVYDFIDDKKPVFVVTRKRFLNELILWAKSPPRPATQEDYIW